MTGVFPWRILLDDLFAIITHEVVNLEDVTKWQGGCRKLQCWS
jgi:hypothetical protein